MRPLKETDPLPGSQLQDSEIISAMMCFLEEAVTQGFVLPFLFEPTDADGDVICRMRLEGDPTEGLRTIDLCPDEVAKVGRSPIELKITDSRGMKKSRTVRLTDDPPTGYAA
jgi:hypothetical protein